MSRNIRRKNPTVSRANRRRDSDTTATSIDLSDDDGYSAVEDISDSEDDNEEDVNAAEESNIVTEDRPSASPRPHFHSVEHDEDDEDDDEEEQEQEDDEEEEEELADDNDEQTSWAGIVSEGEDHQISDFYQEASAFSSDTAGERHVRFDVPDSDSDSTETDDDHGDLFPDIFVSQTALDPAFRREIEDDPDDSSGSGSFWDYSAQYHNQDNDDDDSDAEELIRRLSDDESSTPKASQSASGISLEAPTFDGVQELDGYESECELMTRLRLTQLNANTVALS